MTTEKTAIAATLEALLNHQAEVLAARSTAHMPEGAARLKTLLAKTPRLVSKFFLARAEAVNREYTLAAAQLQSRYLRLLAINNLLQRCSKGADLRSRDWPRLFVPAFRTNPIPGQPGYAAGELLSFDSLARTGDFENAVTAELREMHDSGIAPIVLNAA